MRKIPISEIFGPTLQGEGPVIGRPSVFVRVGGCDYRCNWCDSLYAVLPEYKHEWQKMDEEEILQKVLLLTNQKPVLVTLTGGNPALYDLAGLIEKGHARGLTFMMETQGSKVKPWFKDLDQLVISPKAPSSGMATDWEIVRACLDAATPEVPAALKIVIFNDEDYAFAREARKHIADTPIYLQLGTDVPYESKLGEKANWLLDKVMQDGWHDAIILPQMHVLLWGQKRGV